MGVVHIFLDLVNTSNPSFVTPTVCSNCADKLLSLVTAVHPSLSNLVLYIPSFMCVRHKQIKLSK